MLNMPRPAYEHSRLLAIPYDNGCTGPRLLGKGEVGDYQLLYKFSGMNEDGQVLEHHPPRSWQGIRWVRTESQECLSWVAWEEIEIPRS